MRVSISGRRQLCPNSVGHTQSVAPSLGYGSAAAVKCEKLLTDAEATISIKLPYAY